MKLVWLYIGAPGSGKTTASRKECNFVIDDPTDIEEFNDMKWFVDGCRIGVTCAHMVDSGMIRRFAERISDHDAILETIIIFDAKQEDLISNVMLRGDAMQKPVYGMIERWCKTGHVSRLIGELRKEGDFHFSVRIPGKYA